MKTTKKSWWTNPTNKQLLQPHEIIELPFHYRPGSKTKIAEYYKSGLSLREIQKRGGGGKTKIRSTLIEAGIDLRSFKKGKADTLEVTTVMRAGRTPYGYCYLNGQLVVDNREQEVIHRILEMKQNGLSFRAIATALNNQKVPTRLGKTWRHEVIKQIFVRHKAGK